MTKPMNLTDEQREHMFVTYNVNRFEMYCLESYGMWFVSAYSDKQMLKDDLKLNKIEPKNVNFDVPAARMYLK